MDHDNGFAPNINLNICTLSGCKKNTIEQWAKRDSWVIGIGGNNTGQSNKLIYIMEVAENITFNRFRKKYKRKGKYLKKKDAGSNVLISNNFYYLGNKAIKLPAIFKDIIWQRQGCKCIDKKNVLRIVKYLKKKKYKPGVGGVPNNLVSKTICM